MRLIAMTALHDDDGAFEAIINGKRDQIVEAVKAEMAAQRAQARMVEDSRNRLLSEKLAANRVALARHCGPVRQMMQRIGDAWALLIGTAIVWGEALGLWIWEAQDEQLD